MAGAVGAAGAGAGLFAVSAALSPPAPLLPLLQCCDSGSGSGSRAAVPSAAPFFAASWGLRAHALPGAPPPAGGGLWSSCAHDFCGEVSAGAGGRGGEGGGGN